MFKKYIYFHPPSYTISSVSVSLSTITISPGISNLRVPVAGDEILRAWVAVAGRQCGCVAVAEKKKKVKKKMSKKKMTKNDKKADCAKMRPPACVFYGVFVRKSGGGIVLICGWVGEL
jgi:hypothetical protein